ncbi:MAG: hypothetical protein JZU67_00505, partial [Burkholderiaceae bacterium]|nr:hypothetical protein [Burkholderiaceae bacterium]
QPPQLLRVSSQPAVDSIVLSWNQPVNNASVLGFSTSSVNGYSIEQQIGSTWTPLAQIIEQNIFSYAVSGLNPGTV